ncbi:MAG TPA: uracil-DNA glycosylase family protein [Sphingobium sp.]
MAAAASAYLAWWELAGADCAISEAPVDWLRPAQVARPVPVAGAPAAALLAPKPTTIESFRTWLAEDADQPERRWPGSPILPEGAAGAPLMVITDMPDPADMAAGTLLTDRAGRLFDAMLAAIGLKRSDIYLASMFLVRPPGGMVEAADLAIAADRMRSHVALAAPGKLLLLGDRTIRTFLPVQDNGLPVQDNRRGDALHFFNHDGGTVPALATFHPRLLLGQPAAKAECWRTLQRLIEEQNK